MKITYKGLVGSVRDAADGVVYFGNDNQDVVIDDQKENDYKWPEKDSDLGRNHFKIYYEEKNDIYFVQDMGDGSGTFCRVERRTVNMIFT